MTTPTPDQAREAVDKLVVYANNGWGSACPGEVDTLRRFIDAHSAPVQPEPVAWANAAEWLRNHYQDHPTIDGLCSAMRSASPPPAQPAQADPVPRWWTCDTHGAPPRPNAWDCPECVSEMRQELAALGITW